MCSALFPQRIRAVIAARALRPIPVKEATRVAEESLAAGPEYEGLSAETLPDAALLGALTVLVAVLFFSTTT